MNIEIKISKKPVDYRKAVIFMEKRLDKIKEGKARELIWILEHNDIYTAGSRSKKSEILDKKIKVIKTNRGGKITWHGKGQLICYFVINLNKRNKDIRKFITNIEKSIINTLKEFKIKSFSDRQDIGIWIKIEGNIKKIAAIGIRISKWIAYHGFSININNNLEKYKSIIPCGVKDRSVTSLMEIKKQTYKDLENKLLKKFIYNLENQVF